MTSNEEKIERVKNLCQQIAAVVAAVDLTQPHVPDKTLIELIRLNVDNSDLTDSGFRQFVRNTLKVLVEEKGKAKKGIG